MLGPASLIIIALVSADVPGVSPEIERALISLEAQTEALREVLEPDPRDVIEIQLHRAHIVWYSDPLATAALFNLVLRNTYSGDERDSLLIEAARDPDPASIEFNQVLRRALTADERTNLLIEAARAEGIVGHLQSAMKHYLEAILLGRRGHQLASAFEGFVAVAERAGTVPGVPPVDRYIEAVGINGELDTVGWETVYRLGRVLVRRGDRRGVDVVIAIPAHVPAGRRSLYIQATELLRRGDRDRAKELFGRAATLPPYPSDIDLDPERDRAVREMAWLALGRLAFEAGDKDAGIVAYQQIPIDSPRFIEAYYELGWLAMEAGDEATARHAFLPVVELGANTELGRKAELLRGHMLLEKNQVDAAEAHFERVTTEFGKTLSAFEVALSRIEDLGDLARDCDVRERALRQPFMVPVLKRDGVRAAREMAIKLAEIGTLGYLLETQLEEVDGILAGKGPLNPLAQIAKDRRAIARVLQEVEGLAVRIVRSAARARWWASPRDDGLPPECCGDPRLRAAKLRTILEGFVAELDNRDASLRSELTAIRDENLTLRADQRQLYADLVADVSQSQVQAVAAAAAQERHHLRYMLMEGEAGILEAIWQRKDQNLESIMEAIETRKLLLDRLEERHREVLEE